MAENTVFQRKPGWAEETVFYQFYPMGFCGAPFENDGVAADRITKVMDWIPHLQKLHVGAVYFSPVFESDSHGYDTRDYTKIDCRLGTNEAFRKVCDALHQAGIGVVLDGVFNHVGRGFWAFQDVKQNREASPYKDWFCINFGGNSNYNDGFWYEGWEGHFELVKLNLHNPQVVDYLLSCVAGWMEEFSIDGLRLDVAYSLDEGFLRRLHDFCMEKDPGFFLMGEMIHGDYKRIVNPQMLQSATNYECYKGLYSSFNSLNMFEMGHSLARQFGPEDWTLYRGMHLVCFADNHDVTRIYSILQDKNQLPALYGVLFGMPGIPCLYYGSEWGAPGEKSQGDPALRPCFEAPVENELSEFVGKLAKIKRESAALCHGDFKNETLMNKQWVMRRSCPEETVLVAVNADKEAFTIGCQYHGKAVELLSGETVDVQGQIPLQPYEVKFLKLC
jgi:cyclomaltodextrinase